MVAALPTEAQVGALRDKLNVSCNQCDKEMEAIDNHLSTNLFDAAAVDAALSRVEELKDMKVNHKALLALLDADITTERDTVYRADEAQCVEQLRNPMIAHLPKTREMCKRHLVDLNEAGSKRRASADDAAKQASNMGFTLS